MEELRFRVVFGCKVLVHTAKKKRGKKCRNFRFKGLGLSHPMDAFDPFSPQHK
jgi:hypothetical protein